MPTSYEIRFKTAKLENIATGEVKFSLMGVEHVFGKEFVEYNAVRKIFVVNAYNKRKEFSSEYDRRVHNFDELYSVGMTAPSAPINIFSRLWMCMLKFKRSPSNWRAIVNSRGTPARNGTGVVKALPAPSAVTS